MSDQVQRGLASGRRGKKTIGSYPVIRVATFLDEYRIAINKGSVDGIKSGTFVTIHSEVLDPDTGEILGRLHKGNLVITEVYSRFSVAETYGKTRDPREKWITICVGDIVELK